MNSSSPRVVLVGCGGIARAHLGAIAPKCVVALCDSNLEAAHRLGVEYELSAPVFDSLETALEVQDPNIAVICTPPATHFPLVHSALEAGLHVLCEKPLALLGRDSMALTQAALERDLILRTSAKYRFCSGVVAVKSLLDSGESGALQNLRISFGAPFDFARSWHSRIALSGGGVWMDNGPHALDLARYFAGDLHLESLRDWRFEGDLETEGQVRLRSDENLSVEISLSWMHSLGDHFAVLECEGGTIEIGWRKTSWRPRDVPPRQIADGYDKVACFASQWQGFLNGDPRLRSEDGVCAVELIESIYGAAREVNSPCPSMA